MFMRAWLLWFETFIKSPLPVFRYAASSDPLFEFYVLSPTSEATVVSHSIGDSPAAQLDSAAL